MTYDEAMDAVRTNRMSKPDHQTARTVARRLAWLADPHLTGDAVCCFVQGPHNDEDEKEDEYKWSSEPGLALEWNNSPDWETWGANFDISGWYPTQEDKEATDWEIKGIEAR